jgi:energy-coupling factor transporter ATP-binding protein EcfA2
MGDIVLGRDEILDSVETLAFSGETVLVYGPPGIGKTAILSELARRAGQAGRPCAICPRTERLSDVTEALVRGYATGTGALTQRQRRSRVRLAIERKPGILLLDHLLDVGNAVKGYLRSLRGTGLGVVIAVDVEQARDHVRIRARGLAYRELALPPLHGRYQRRLLDREIESQMPPHPISESERDALMQVAQGRPGWIVRLVAATLQARYWREDRLLIDLLAADVSMAIASHYRARLNERWSRR